MTVNVCCVLKMVRCLTSVKLLVYPSCAKTFWYKFNCKCCNKLVLYSKLYQSYFKFFWTISIICNAISHLSKQKSCTYVSLGILLSFIQYTPLSACFISSFPLLWDVISFYKLAILHPITSHQWVDFLIRIESYRAYLQRTRSFH